MPASPDPNTPKRLALVEPLPAPAADLEPATEPGCRVCAVEVDSERIFFRWFQIETHASAPMLESLYRSRGMCETHARRQLMLTELRSPTKPTTALVIASALASLTGRMDKERGLCPACAATDRHGGLAEFELLQTAGNAASAGRRVPICARHAEHTASESTSELREGQRALRRQFARGRLAGLTDIYGLDSDARLRARLRLPQKEISSETVVQEFVDRLETDACPVCSELGSNESLYLHALSAAVHADPDLPRRQGLLLCRRHLYDVLLVDRTIVPIVLPVVAVRRAQEAARRLTWRLEQRRWRSAPPDPQRLDGSCAICRSAKRIEERQLDLLATLLRDSGVRHVYENGHGLCMHHYEILGDRDTTGVARERLEVRLRTLQWEVEEDRRKMAWDDRFEHKGGEVTAWARSLVQIDGRVTLGWPAEDAIGWASC